MSIQSRMLPLLEAQTPNMAQEIRKKARNKGEFHMLSNLYHDKRLAAHQMGAQRAKNAGDMAGVKRHQLKAQYHAGEVAHHEKEFDKATTGRKAFVGRMTLSLKPKQPQSETWAGGMGAGLGNHFEPSIDQDLQQTVKFDTGDELWTAAPASTAKSSSNGGRSNTSQRR